MSDTDTPAAISTHEQQELLDAERMTSAPKDPDSAAEPAGEPDPGTASAAFGITGWLRWTWRQLTSMRVALILLFLLSLASVPGTLIPQQSLAPFNVSRFRRDHTLLAPLYDKLQLFHVYSSVWFSAIYLLLFISLAGCIIPRCRQFVTVLRAKPPTAPHHLARLPVFATWSTRADPAEVLDAAQQLLRGRRFRVHRAAHSADAEKGYLREVGNLLFHVSLFGMLIAFAVSRLFGGMGTVVVVEGSGFTNTVTQYDDFMPSTFFTSADLAPLGFTLDSFNATYQSSGGNKGTPQTFAAKVRYWQGSTAATSTPATISVNHPLELGETKIFLTAHGYAPVLTVRDSKGQIAYRGATPCLPQDANVTSTCAIKVPDYTDSKGRATQLGFQGIFAPTAEVSPGTGPHSVFPAPNNPGLFLTGFSGDLGMNAGSSQSVYQLVTTNMTQFQLAGKPLAVALHPGQGFKLPTGGTLTFDGVKQWVNFTVSRNPGNSEALASALLATLGLCGSLFVRRRRIWVRALPGPNGTTIVELAGLARSEGSPLAEEIADLALALQDTAPADPAPVQTEPAAKE